MNPIGNNYRLENFYTPNQQAVFKRAPQSIRNLFVEDLLESENDQDLTAGQLALDILDVSPSSHQSTGEKFLGVLLSLRNDKTIQALQKVLKIAKSPLEALLFECAYTEQKEYYSCDELMEMINLVDENIARLPQPCPPLKRFSPFNQGGREILLQIRKDPKNILNFLQKQEGQGQSHSNVPKTLQEIVQNTQNQGFDAMKAEALRYLSSLDEQLRLPMSSYLALFKGFQGDLKYKKMSALERKCVLILLLATTSKTRGVASVSSENIQELLNLAVEIHETCGEEILIWFCMAPDTLKGVSIDQALRIMHLLKNWHIDVKSAIAAKEFLKSFFQDKIHFNDLVEALEKNIPFQTLVPVEDKTSLDALFNRFSGVIKDPTVQFPLPANVLQKVKQQYIQVHDYCKKWKDLRLRELVKLAHSIYIKGHSNVVKEDDILQLAAIGRLAIRIQFGVYLYNTQVCAVLAQLYHPEGAVAQIKTGEGKSFIATLLGFVLSMRSVGQGHIISSGLLSIRDQSEQAHFFRIFGITTGHICEQEPDASKFQPRILYGRSTDYEFAIMREMLYFKKLFPDQALNKGKRFKWVIIDEMDNLTIDTSLSGARLSSTAEVTYDWVYIPIFHFAKKHLTSEGAITPKLVEDLRTYLKSYMGGKFKTLADEFSNKKLINWLRSASIAIHKREEKKHYIIGWKDSRQGEKVKGILIVDAENTGRIMHGSRWTGGIHEFIGVKHGLDVERENICPISMCHPLFYPLYHCIYGVTGTAGSRFEREELKQIYGITSFDVPTHNPSQRIDEGMTICKTDADFIECIFQRAVKNVEKKRSLLILCETIQDTELFSARLTKENIPHELLNEIQKKSEKEVLEAARLPGAITIATNTGARGADIKLVKETLQNGGLHVLIAYYPPSERVEMQARGRAGRQGQPGSSEIILSYERLNKDPEIAALKDNEAIPFLLKRRKKKAMEEKEIHYCYSEVERFAFEMVREFYELLNKFNTAANSDHFITTLATFLNRRKFIKKETKDYSHLSPKNRKIGEAILQLLCNPNDATLSWKVLVKQLIQRVQDHVINDFALNFHALISESIESSGVTSGFEIANQLKELGAKQKGLDEFTKALEALFLQLSTTKLKEIQDEIKEAYEKQKPLWERYLDLSGRGILKYLSDLSQIDLNPVKTDIFIPPWVSSAQPARFLAFEKDFDSEPKSTESPFLNGKKPMQKKLAEEYPIPGAEIERKLSAYQSKLSSQKVNFHPSYLEEIVIPPFKPDSKLPEPPQAGIRMGLTNFGSTCWANSFLKFISCTNMYDQMLTKTPPPGMERLQGLLREIVISLRISKDISDAFLMAFLREVEKNVVSISIGIQQDAPEFFLALLHLLQWKPIVAQGPNMIFFPRTAILYQPLSNLPQGQVKYPQVEKKFQTHLDVTFHADTPDDQPIDLAQLIADEGTRDVRPDLLSFEVNTGLAEVSFQTTTCLVNLPNTLMIYLKRGIIKQGETKKLEAPIQLDSNHQTALMLYEPQYKRIGKKNIATDLVAKGKHLYCIGAAVEHIGNSLARGHYICYERAKDGQLLIHDDSQIRMHSTEADFGVKGYFLRLDKV